MSIQQGQKKIMDSVINVNKTVNNEKKKKKSMHKSYCKQSSDKNILVKL